MRYSYCWTVSPTELADCRSSASGSCWEDRYVELSGRFLVVSDAHSGKAFIGEKTRQSWPRDPTGLATPIRPAAIPVVPEPGKLTVGPRGAWRGRVTLQAAVGEVDSATRRISYKAELYLDEWASRFHPASVAGLVVAVFVTFVFALYLRRWLGERRPGSKVASAEGGTP